jgi:ribonuclease P protein component
VVTVRFLARRGNGPHVAYAVGRRVGIAVVRNRVRRRLRAIVSTLGCARPSLVHDGYYLVAVTPAAATMSYQALENDVAGALAGLDRLEGSLDQ